MGCFVPAPLAACGSGCDRGGPAAQANVLWWELMGETLTISGSSVSEALMLMSARTWGIDTLLGPEGTHCEVGLLWI
jgi:hypothetical protein